MDRRRDTSHPRTGQGSGRHTHTDTHTYTGHTHATHTWDTHGHTDPQGKPHGGGGEERSRRVGGLRRVGEVKPVKASPF